MLRTIFSAALMAVVISFAAVTSAATNFEVLNVSVIMEPPVESFDKPEKIRAAIQQTVDKIFKNASAYSVQSIDETAGYVQIYREENELEAVDNAFLKKSDLDKICQNLDSDFVVYLRVSNSEVKSADPISRKVNVVLDFRIWSNEKQDFTYTRRTTMTGSGYGYGAVADAVEEGLKKGLQEVEKDARKVRAAMEG